MKFCSYVVLCLAFVPSSAEAACGGTGLSLTAPSPSLSEVSGCITAAVSGATVSVPAGSGTWTSALVIPPDKNVTLKGAGIGQTVITCAGTCVTIASAGRSSASRITGFTFKEGVIGLTGLQEDKVFRVDHNEFTSTSLLREWIISGYTSGIHPTGLIDNNVMFNQRIVVEGTIGQLADGNWQHQLWARPYTLGDFSEVIYIEHNAVTNHVFSNMPDCNYGGRYVFRYNMLKGTVYTEAHSIQANNRACTRWEIYGNTYDDDGRFQHQYRTASLRGGTGVVFNNASPFARVVIDIDNVRSCHAVVTAAKCDGSSNWDQNAGPYGYVCRDQIGRGADVRQWSVRAPYAQLSRPAYFWDNRAGAGQMKVNVRHDDAACSGTGLDLNTTHVRRNRDFYEYTPAFDGTEGVGSGPLASRPETCTTGVAYWANDVGEWDSTHAGLDGQLYNCTAVNTWTVYYTPYRYPHPASMAPPAPVANVRVIR